MQCRPQTRGSRAMCMPISHHGMHHAALHFQQALSQHAPGQMLQSLVAHILIPPGVMYDQGDKRERRHDPRQSHMAMAHHSMQVCLFCMIPDHLLQARGRTYRLDTSPPGFHKVSNVYSERLHKS